MSNTKISNLFLSLKQNNKIPHNFLLIGQENVLKKEVQKISKIIVCKQNYTCTNCDKCIKITQQNERYFYKVEPINGKISVLQIKKLISWVTFKTKDKKIYHIQNIEKITKQSANKLLKFLENENENYFGIITTSNYEKLLKTIKSRLMSFKVNNDSFDLLYLQEKFSLTSKEKLFLKFINKNRFYFDKDFYQKTFLVLQEEISYFKKILEKKNFALLYEREILYEDNFIFFLFLEFLIINFIIEKETIKNEKILKKWNKIIHITKEILFDNQKHHLMYQKNLKSKICFLKWSEKVISFFEV